MRVGSLVHPVKSFRKAVSAVMDDLVKCDGYKDHSQLAPYDDYDLTSKIDNINNNLLKSSPPCECPDFFLVGL